MDCLKDLNCNYCTYHPYQEVIFIKISQENRFELKCEECALSESCLNNYISLQTIRCCSEDHIFRNWPPVNNDSLLKDIKAILKVNSELIEQIEYQFDNITRKITSFLAAEKKNMIQQAISLGEQIDKMLQSYHQISDISKLKQLINWNSKNIKSKINELNQYITKQFQNKEKNTSILEEQIKNIKKEQILQYDFSKLQQVSNDYLYQFTYQIKDLLRLGMQNNICQLFGTFNCSNQILYSQVEVQEDILQNQISIKKTTQDCYGQIYFKYNLTKKNKYIVRIKFNHQGGNNFIIGLAGQSSLDVNLTQTGLAKAFVNRNYNNGDVEVDDSCSHKIEQYLIVEMRIDIKQKKLQFLDYPNYNYVNELDHQKFDKNETYYLAIEFLFNSQQDTFLDLIHFEVEKN
ncbi:hypothetical protein ABPG74_002620 [Tetrahymena malaccensis]